MDCVSSENTSDWVIVGGLPGSQVYVQPKNNVLTSFTVITDGVVFASLIQF